MQDVILKPDPSKNDTMVLKKSLSCSYPNLPFDEALQKENEKLQVELQISQANMDVGQCEVIQHLIDVTETVASTLPENSASLKDSKNLETNYSDTTNGHSADNSYVGQSNDTHSALRLVSFFLFLFFFLKGLPAKGAGPKGTTWTCRRGAYQGLNLGRGVSRSLPSGLCFL